MRAKEFDQWHAFRVDKDYARNCQQFSSGQHGCYAVDGSTRIIRVHGDGYNGKYDYYTFSIQPHQETLFYHLVERDGFDRVNSKISHYTYTYNADDNGGYDYRKHSIPQSSEAQYVRKRNFPLGYIQTKLALIQLQNINEFTLQKVENMNVNGMYYKFIVNNEHIMSVDKYETNLFFEIIDKQFVSYDKKIYRRK